MRAIGIRHEVEWLAELDQAVHQAFCALVMHVVVAGAVHDQQAPLESLGLIDRRRTVVARAVRRRVQETHIALLVNRVVEALVRHRSYGHPDPIDVGVTKHRLQRARSAAAPAPDRDARRVEIVARSREGTHRVRLLSARQNADRAVDHFSPRAAARRRRAAIVHGGHYVALIRDHVLPQVTPAPGVLGRLTRRLAVDVHQQRIDPRGVEICWLDHPTIDRDSIRHRHLEEFTGTGDDRCHRRPLFGVVDECPHDPTRRQLHQLYHRGAVEVRVGMKSPAGVGGNPVRVPTRRGRRRHPDRGGGLLSIEPRAIQIALRRVVRRRDVVEPLTGLVQRRDVDGVEVAGRDVRDALPVAADPIDVPPAVALTRPQELGSLRKPCNFVHHIDPGTVALGEDRAGGSCRRIRQHDPVGILEPVDAL